MAGSDTTGVGQGLIRVEWGDFAWGKLGYALLGGRSGDGGPGRARRCFAEVLGVMLVVFDGVRSSTLGKGDGERAMRSGVGDGSGAVGGRSDTAGSGVAVREQVDGAVLRRL